MTKGMNNIEVRIINRKSIIAALYQHGGMTSQAIARSLGLSLPTVSVILKELTRQGLVSPGAALKSSGGRRPLLNILKSDARFAVGISLSPHNIRLVLANLSEILVRSCQPAAFTDTPAYWTQLLSLVKQFIQDAQVDLSRFLGFGLSLPGIISPDQTQVNCATAFGVQNLDLKKVIASLPGDTVVANDARLAGLTLWLGYTKNESAVYLLLNDSIEGAILTARAPVGRALPGNNNRAGAFGHMTIIEGGQPCACGQNGCLEAYCSAGALRAAAGMELAEFFALVKTKDARQLKIWQEYLGHLAIGILNLRVSFDSDVIIGGELCSYIREEESELKAILNARSPFGETADYLIIDEPDEYKPAIGAAALQIDKFLS
jgi:N-acetylglucosamine repressor